MHENEYCDVIIETFNANDEEYKIVGMHISDGQYVESDQILFTLETSKASFEVLSPMSGYFQGLNIKDGDIVNPQQIVGYIKSNPEQKIALSDEQNLKKKMIIGETFSDAKLVSRKARKLIAEHELNMNVFDNISHVTELDVLRHLGHAEEYEIPLPAVEVNHRQNSIYLFGGQGTARMLIDLLQTTACYKIEGIIDDQLDVGSTIDGVEVIGTEDWFIKKFKDTNTNLALAFTQLNNLKKRYEKYKILKKLGFNFPTIIHKDARVERSCEISEGCIILSGSILGSHAKLAPMNFVNTGSIVSHEVIAGPNNHFAPGCAVAGKVDIGSNNVIGMNASIYMGISITDNHVIVNNQTVFKNLT